MKLLIQLKILYFMRYKHQDNQSIDEIFQLVLRRVCVRERGVSLN